MSCETSHDVGCKPFNHDTHRGKWAAPMDFFFACIGCAFRIDTIFLLPAIIFQDMGPFAVIPYFVFMVFCTIPIIYLQSFLGQFSSTGSISAFRLAPLFKGIGYVSLAVNVITLTYYSVLAGIPLLYVLHSLRPNLPWSCEGSIHSLVLNDHKIKYDHPTLSLTAAAFQPCNLTNVELDAEEYVPSLDFFLKEANIYPWPESLSKTTFSWPLMLCTVVIWVIVWLVLRKSTQRIGQIVRYSTMAVLAALATCVIRFAFLPGALPRFGHIFSPGFMKSRSMLCIPLIALSGLGPGWGGILTMASYNKFKINLTKHTWLIGLGQLGLMVLGLFSWISIENFLLLPRPGKFFLHRHLQYGPSPWNQFMSIPTALSLMEAPHFWTLLFFGMLTVGATNLLVVQLFTVTTSLFDEFEPLRRRRREVIRIATGLLALASTVFCSNHGVMVFKTMSNYSVFSQIFLNLMLVLVVLWIYGRARFQRDVHFMTSRVLPTWMVCLVKFITPIVLILSFIAGVWMVATEGAFHLGLYIAMPFIIVLPWLLIPGYCIFKIVQTNGLLGRRIKRSVQPINWYPLDPIEREEYEEAFCKPDISNQLTTFEDDL